MKNIFSRIFSKNDSQKEINSRLSEKLNNSHIKYITEKDANSFDSIIAREAHINIVGESKDELCATEGTKTVFRLKISDMKIWEFMSLDGCVITFFDTELKKERTVNVYYEKHLS